MWESILKKRSLGVYGSLTYNKGGRNLDNQSSYESEAARLHLMIDAIATRREVLIARYQKRIMMKEIELKDGRIIRIKPMDKSFIIPGGEGRCPANCDMREAGDMAPTVKFRVLSEKLIERYGTSAILAMHKDLVIGFISFYPQWVTHYNMCNDEEIDEAVKHLDDIEFPPPQAKPVLHISCLVIKEKYRGNQLSVHLLEYLKTWARDRRWRKIVASGCIFSGRAQYQWLISPKPPKCIWERAGFLAGEDFHLPKPHSAYESAQQNREWYRTYEFPEYVPRDVDPDDKDWYEIFSDYTMICEL